MRIIAPEGTLEGILPYEFQIARDERLPPVRDPTTAIELQVLLSGLITQNSRAREQARERTSELSVFDRVRMKEAISTFAPAFQPALRTAFRPYRVGLDAEDFALPLETREYAQGTPLFIEGERGHEAYAVRRGRIAILKEGKCLHTYSPGDVFGEYALLFETQRTAHAISLLPAQVAVIDAALYYETLRGRNAQQVKDEIILARKRLADARLDSTMLLREEIFDLLIALEAEAE
ncbi:cyclic nucleotide-binding domain-containing protein [Candidatus Pacearchaeota archaeon]|nr:cyclic nucleotide-binding domain-containing protein [Candidatus Pacearchaeota archaeon]